MTTSTDNTSGSISAVQYPQVPSPTTASATATSAAIDDTTAEGHERRTHIATPAPILPPRHQAAQVDHEGISSGVLHDQQQDVAQHTAVQHDSDRSADTGAPLPPPPHHGNAAGTTTTASQVQGHAKYGSGIQHDDHQQSGATSSAHSSPSHHANSYSHGDSPGNKIGGSIKSAYNVVHGGMEVLRGTMLGLADTGGDLVASRRHGHGDGEPASPRTQSSNEVIAKGREEFERGMGSFRN